MIKKCKNKGIAVHAVFIWLIASFLSIPVTTSRAANSSDYHSVPPFVTAGVPPLVMLVMSRNHKLYYEAYNDASDLDEDGYLDVGYKPTIDYYGYFDSYKCYTYSSAKSRFEPSSVTEDKTVNADNEWSGDFLNYLTMSRIDTLRKVLYGGYRSTDTDTETVLERSFVPQDAHSWGKEYYTIDHDGYDIREYTPLELPENNTRHLFANTTIDANNNNIGYDDPPLLRVLPNNTHRIWEWVAKERPVCDDSLEYSGGHHTSHPQNHTEFDVLFAQFGNETHKQGEQAVEQIDGIGNPFGNNDNYLTLFQGELLIAEGEAGTYEFAVDGDDAVEVIINEEVVADWYGGHGACNCQTHNGTIDLEQGTHTIEFRHEEVSGSDSYTLWWKKPSAEEWEIVPSSAFNNLIQTTYNRLLPASQITDYVVRVKVCDSAVGLEPNSKLYPDGMYKPIGILQRHGESNRMYFGLMTGSYTKNTSGGVLRKNIGSIKDEIHSGTGKFLYKEDSTVGGIISTIDKLRVDGFRYGNSYDYNENCGWITTRAMKEGECRMWGNPVAEMMYETLRYFSDETEPTTDFTYGTSSDYDDNQLGLPKPDWIDPYTGGGYDYCAKPFMMVLSDIYPNFDSDQLPGSRFGSVSSSLGALDAEEGANTIFSFEGGISDHFIGQSDATYDGACTPKTVGGFGDIRGLCPEEPTKQGSYYAPAVAHYGATNDLHSATGDQKVGTYAVALSSPFPEININVGGHKITLVPFGKSVGGGSWGISAAQGDFQPTNTIVDFFVEQITPTYGKFRINFEDVEQGADHDMDAIVEYEYQVVNGSDDPVTDPEQGVRVVVTLNSIYAAGSIIQHMGYIISGTSADGTYLEVRDFDTGEASDPDYFLDTPPGVLPGGNWEDDEPLPLTAERTFEPGSVSASFLTNPLWYAAKWGGFDDYNDNQMPDLDNEWDKDDNDVPDTYFFVQNPLKLEEQLNRSFADILRKTASGTAASVISQTRSGEGAVYQAIFIPEYKDPTGNTASWIGAVQSLLVDEYGNMREDTNGNGKLDMIDDLVIVFRDTVVEKYKDKNGDGAIEDYEDDDGNPVIEENPVFSGSMDDIKFLWTSTDWLNQMDDEAITQQIDYGMTSENRYIFTFADQNEDGIPDDGEIVDFTTDSLSAATLSDVSTFYPYLNIFPTFGDEPTIFVTDEYKSLNALRHENYEDLLEDLLIKQTKRVIDYIRGADQNEYVSGEYGYILPPFRSRKVDYNDDGIMDTWRLGDIVYSTPTVVGRPAEAYHLLYRDSSYAKFADTFKNRRQVVYVGANDGMFHAFNGGFYDSNNKEFKLTGEEHEKEYPLGSELWAYVPYNLLPHLYWLTETTYPHVYYNDLKPKVFDAKILPDNTHYDAGGDLNWGTFIVGGMRFGGGEILADIDKTDGSNVTEADRTMTSAYYIFDITDPEVKPTLIAEFSFDHLGYTTCYPAVIPMKDKTDEGINQNDWYLVFGSGPADATGKAGILESLGSARSSQSAKLYVVDLKKLTDSADPAVITVEGEGDTEYFQSLDSSSFISDPVSVDYNLDYNADVVYFGTVSWDSDNEDWGGKLRRIRIDNNLDTDTWEGDSVLMDTEQPITAAATVAMDDRGKKWVYFGTGRFFVVDDKLITDSYQQSYYGIIEPFNDNDPEDEYMNSNESLAWTTVAKTDLLDVSDAEVYNDRSVTEIPELAPPVWDSLVATIDRTSDHNGWFLNFGLALTERNLGQATLIGELLTFTTYTPSDDICSFEGESNLYGLYYKTGTAYYRSVIGTIHRDANDDGEIDTGELEIKKTVSLGKGLAVTPNIHVGKKEGSKAFVQTSTGAIEIIEQINPANVKSGVISWEDME